MQPIETIIRSRLTALEQEEQVGILYACESGSRSWGFASTDSDYDVRFIYIHPPDWYLSVHERRDVIERPLQDGIDVSGWDIRKALGLFRKSNPPLFEWLNSPTVYQQKSSFAARIKPLMTEYYSPQACLHHYLHMAQGNFRAYLCDETVPLKKYFYVLRPVLACLWIERKPGVVPMEFARLTGRLIEDPALNEAIQRLLEAKMAGVELNRGPKIPAIHGFLEAEIARLSHDHKMDSSQTRDIVQLDELFRATLKEVWP